MSKFVSGLVYCCWFIYYLMLTGDEVWDFYFHFYILFDLDKSLMTSYKGLSIYLCFLLPRLKVQILSQ